MRKLGKFRSIRGGKHGFVVVPIGQILMGLRGLPTGLRTAAINGGRSGGNGSGDESKVLVYQLVTRRVR